MSDIEQEKNLFRAQLASEALGMWRRMYEALKPEPADRDATLQELAQDRYRTSDTMWDMTVAFCNQHPQFAGDAKTWVPDASQEGLEALVNEIAQRNAQGTQQYSLPAAQHAARLELMPMIANVQIIADRQLVQSHDDAANALTKALKGDDTDKGRG